MTDKEKILTKIESLLNETNYEPFTDEVFGRIQTLKELKSYIDSLQEEPVSELWHDASEEQPEGYRDVVVWNPTTMDGEVLTRCAEVYKGRIWAYIDDILNLSNVERIGKGWKEEPASEDLEEAAKNVGQKYFPNEYNIWARPNYEAVKIECAFKEGAKWQKVNLWKAAQGDDLPEIDREVIVLYQRYPLENNEYAVGFAHRPPEYWDGRNIETDEVTRYYPKRYDKGGWNSPDVKFWLDLELPIYRKGE